MVDPVQSQSMQSSASRPDLDWSQVRETIRMLCLAVSQIEVAMKDSNESVDVLANSFTTMFGHVQAIANEANTLAECETRQNILNTCGVVSSQIREAIIAFQFYDRLVQRLSHASHSLDALGDLIADGSRLYNPHEWFGMQQKIRSKYTMEEERLMFDALIQGKSVRQALDLYAEMKIKAQSSDDVELF